MNMLKYVNYKNYIVNYERNNKHLIYLKNE